MDKNSGPLFPSAFPGYRDYNGGGKPNPPTVNPVQHYGYLAGTERAASYPHSVRQRGGEKVMADDRIGDA